MLYSRELITVADTFTVNVEIPYSTFNIEFPAGLFVYDYRTGEKIEIK